MYIYIYVYTTYSFYTSEIMLSPLDFVLSCIVLIYGGFHNFHHVGFFFFKETSNNMYMHILDIKQNNVRQEKAGRRVLPRRPDQTVVS